MNNVVLVVLIIASFMMEAIQCQKNMNSIQYTIANPTNTTPKPSLPFYGEYFEVLGPEVTTKYSQVYWKSQPVELPADIVDRFDEKIMAVTGMEVDIVRTMPDGSTKSAPSYELYNHHYSGWMYGKYASPSTKEHGSDDNPKPDIDQLAATIPMAHGKPLPQWNIQSKNDYPNVQAFSEGNGNEHRGAYKGYAKGYAQLINSPKTWANNPMIINTNKRLTNDTSPGYISRYVPKHSLAPNDSLYSGILECPCTDRKIKVLNGYKLSIGDDSCTSTLSVSTLKECIQAASKLGLSPASIVEDNSDRDGTLMTTTTSSSLSSCTAKYDDQKDVWNVSFGKSYSVSSSSSSSSNLIGSTKSMNIQSTVNIVLSGPANQWFGVALNATTMSDTPYAIIIDGNGNVTERILSNHASGSKCKRSSITIIENHVINGVRKVIMERPIVSECYTFPIQNSNQMKNDTMLTMPILAAHGTTSTFNYHGTTRASTIFTMISSNSFLNICRDPNSNEGTIDGIVFNSNVCAPYPESELLTSKNAICNITRYEGGLYCCHHNTILLDTNQPVPTKTDTWRLKYRFYFEEFIPTSSNRSSDSSSSSSTKDSHQNLFRTWWSTEATNNEYDVPKSESNCNDSNTPSSECIHEIRSQFQGIDMIRGAHGGGGSQCMVSGDPSACGNITLIKERDNSRFKLMYMAAHCHTPACISLELWNDDTGELICKNEPIYGNSTKAQNENKYVISIPPCLFGSKEEGLMPPPIISLDSNLTTIKRANNVR
jgi:hypothetical protein